VSVIRGSTYIHITKAHTHITKHMKLKLDPEWLIGCAGVGGKLVEFDRSLMAAM
jgi:hypothetical protein